MEMSKLSSGEFLTPSRHGPGSCLQILLELLLKTQNGLLREARKWSCQDDRSVVGVQGRMVWQQSINSTGRETMVLCPQGVHCPLGEGIRKPAGPVPSRKRPAAPGSLSLPLHPDERWGDKQQLRSTSHPNATGATVSGWKTTYQRGKVYAKQILCVIFLFFIIELGSLVATNSNICCPQNGTKLF